MATVFIIAHAPLASALAAAAEHLGLAHGPLLALDVLPEWGAAETLAQAQAALALAPAEGGVEPELLLLTDAFGATPCGQAARLGSSGARRLRGECADAVGAVGPSPATAVGRTGATRPGYR
jgi:mannose PTS system EIIA component